MSIDVDQMRKGMIGCESGYDVDGARERNAEVNRWWVVIGGGKERRRVEERPRKDE